MNEQEFMQWLGECSHEELREAMTRNEYADLMKKGLKGLLIGAYQRATAKTTYQELVTVETSDSDKEDYPSIGDPAYPKEVKEGERFKQLNPGAPDNIPVTNFKYGGTINITEEAADDDKTPGKALAKQALRLGPKHAAFKDKVFYSLITANGTIYDGNAFFSANHPGYTGGAALANCDNRYSTVTLSANSLAVGISMVALWEGAEADHDLDIEVVKIVVPKRLLAPATGLVSAQNIPLAYAAGIYGPQAASGSTGLPTSVAGGRGLKVVSSHRLDATATTDWYLWTDFPGLLYQKRKGLRVVQEAMNAGEGFSRSVLRFRSDERFGRKVVNWRTGMLVD